MASFGEIYCTENSEYINNQCIESIISIPFPYLRGGYLMVYLIKKLITNYFSDQKIVSSVCVLRFFRQTFQLAFVFAQILEENEIHSIAWTNPWKYFLFPLEDVLLVINLIRTDTTLDLSQKAEKDLVVLLITKGNLSFHQKKSELQTISLLDKAAYRAICDNIRN